MARDDVAFTYDPTQNPDGASLPDVPLRGLTMRDFARQPEHVRAAIRVAPYFVATDDFRAAWDEPAPRARRSRTPRDASE